MLRRTPKTEVSDLKEIGQGGQSTVYSGSDPIRGTVAVKIFHLKSNDSEKPFTRERDVLKRLKGIDSIVNVYRTGVTADHEPYLVMQYLPGGSLQDLVESEGAMPWRKAAEHISRVARAVDGAHQHGVLHADIKPSNILLDENDKPHISDFGISKIVDHQKSVTTRLMFTPNYVAPEILDEAEETTATDIYALGATVAALVTGRPPFQSTGKNSIAGVLRRVIDDPPPTLTEYGAPVRLTTAVRKAMAKDPGKRFSTAGEFATALEESLSNGETDNIVIATDPYEPKQPNTAPATTDDPIPLWRSRRAAILVLVAITLSFTAAALYLSRPEDLSPRQVSVAADGSGDYTTLAEALLAVPPLSTIKLEPGFYRLEQGVVINKPISIVGSGRDETRIAGKGTTPALQADGSSVVIEDLTINYDGPSQGVDVMRLTNAEIRLIDVAVKNGSGNGLVVEGASTGIIEGSLFANNKGSGLVLDGTSDLNLSDNTARDNQGSGFVWNTQSVGSAQTNLAERNEAEGFLIVGTSQPELTNNTSSNNRESGFTWRESGSGTLRNNTATLNSGYGFAMLDESGAILINNTSSENRLSGFSWRHESIGEATDNKSNNNRNHGFVIADTASPAITEGSADGNSQTGFIWLSTSDGSLRENTATGNTFDGFIFGENIGAIEIINNAAYENKRSGFGWRGPIVGSVSGNSSRENLKHGFELGPFDGGALRGNSATNNSGRGFDTTQPGILQDADNTASGNELGDWYPPTDETVDDAQGEPVDSQPTDATNPP